MLNKVRKVKYPTKISYLKKYNFQMISQELEFGDMIQASDVDIIHCSVGYYGIYNVQYLHIL